MKINNFDGLPVCGERNAISYEDTRDFLNKYFNEFTFKLISYESY